MMRFKDPNHLPAQPVSWRTEHNGRYMRVPWNSGVSWESFYGTVVKFTQDNGIDTPTEAEVQNVICSQYRQSGVWCTSDQTFHRPASVPRRPGCKTCGRR